MEDTAVPAAVAVEVDLLLMLMLMFMLVLLVKDIEKGIEIYHLCE